jgi:hypothetical protein
MTIFGEVIDEVESDFRYVADKTLDFVQYQTWRNALLDTANEITKATKRGKRPDYEKALGRFQTAFAMRTATDEILFDEASNMEPEIIEWLWLERVALKKLSLVVGDPESGKSLFTTWMAAHVSSGTLWPDHCTPPRGGVLILQNEDGTADTGLPRLIQYGADRSKVAILRGAGIRTVDNQERMFSLLQDVDKLKKEILRRGDVKMVILDPLQAYFGGALSGKVNTNADAHIRAILGPLKAMAEETGVAVVGVTHLNKASQTDMMYRIGGSIGIMAIARSVWLIKWDRDPDGMRYFQTMKSNRKAGVSGLAFKINKDNGDETFEDAPVPMARELLSSTFAEAGALDAQSWLRGRLASGPKYARDLLEEGEMEGFSRGMLHRAKKALGIEARRVGSYGRGARWEWYRPEQESD